MPARLTVATQPRAGYNPNGYLVGTLNKTVTNGAALCALQRTLTGSTAGQVVFEGLNIVGLGTYVLRYNATVCITEVGVTKCRWFDWVSDPFLNTFHDATYIR